MKTYVEGAVVHFDMKFSRAGTATNPDDITLRIYDGTTVTAYTYGTDDIQLLSTGKFSIEVAGLVAGSYKWYIVGTGDAPAAASGTFVVTPSIAAP